MDYENFKEQFKEDVKQELQERGTDDVNITFNRVEKMNESYDAMTITPGGSNIGMNLNMDKFFEAYENGADFDAIVSNAVTAIENNIINAPSFDVSMLTDYEQMKDEK